MTSPIKRAAIVGTAETWTLTPWNDPSLHIVSLNDAWVLGLPRTDEHYELHPLDHLYFRDPRKKIVNAADVPPGHYVRPQGHLEQLQQMARTLPVWLQAEPPAGWPPNAQRFPIEALEAKYGTYWASGPAYELLHLYDRGYREIHIYGIHLATAEEYRNQRPNFEHLIGRLLGPQVTLSITDGLRTYQGETGVRIVLPVASPILQHGWRYALEPKPTPPPDPLKDELKAVAAEKDALVRALVNWPVGKDKRQALARLQRLEVIALDIQQQRAKRHLGAPLVARVA